MEETPETAITTTTPQKTAEIELDSLPMLLGLGEYTPTVKQAQAVYLFITSETPKPIHQIVGDITYDASLWYKWKKKPGFLQWFEKVCHTTFSTEKLLDVHAQIYRRALGNSPADSKLFMQRFDPLYTERTQQDNRVTFGGYEPSAADDSRERQRKALAEQGESPPVLQQVTRVDPRDQPLEPDTPGCADADTRAQTPASGATGGVAPPCTHNPHALQVQSQCNEDQDSTQSHDDNDKTLDSEPITPTRPPAPPFET